MEQQTLSPRALCISILLHILIMLLLLYITQSDSPFSFLQPRAEEQEPLYTFIPTQPPQSTSTTFVPPAAQMPQATIAPQAIPQQQPQKETITSPETTTESGPNLSTTGAAKKWSSERARNAWRKPPAQPNPEEQKKETAQPQQKTTMHQIFNQGSADGGYHELLANIPIDPKGVPLRQRINAQFAKEGQEHFQMGVIRAICYELNKQKIMEATSNLPSKIIFKIILDRKGNVLAAQLTQKSYSASFDVQCLKAVRAAAPYRSAPASMQGDNITIEFTLFHDHAMQGSASNVPTPITFFLNA